MNVASLIAAGLIVWTVQGVSDQFAWVTSVQGTWVDQAAGGVRVRKNHPISRGARLRCIDRDKRASRLEVKVRQNGNTKIFACADGLTCERPLDLTPLEPQEPQAFPQLLWAFLTARRLNARVSECGSPCRAAAPEPAHVLRESIGIEGGPIALDDIFVPGVAAGQYPHRVLSRHDRSRGSGCPTARNPVSIERSSSGGGTLDASTMPAGLYLVVRWLDDLRSVDRALLWLGHSRALRPHARRSTRPALHSRHGTSDRRASPPRGVPASSRERVAACANS